MAQKRCIIVAGPTGVGKSVFAEQLGVAIDGEIVNGDLGQFYVPLTIGTAKPNWRAASIAHHLFDVLNEPVNFSVMAFRNRVKALCRDIWYRHKIPIIVGGSSYYLAVLFVPPVAHTSNIQKRTYDQSRNWWDVLFAVDPLRAQEIDPHDTYRIERALDIWYSTGIKPSVYKPIYDPISPFICIWLERDRHELYQRINERVVTMIREGWIDEVRSLLGTPWQDFVQRKKIIGYPQVISYCFGLLSKQEMISTIQTKTRNYAKRQITFWKTLSKKIEEGITAMGGQHCNSIIITMNLTHEPIDRYIKHVAALCANRIIDKRLGDPECE